MDDGACEPGHDGRMRSKDDGEPFFVCSGDWVEILPHAQPCEKMFSRLIPDRDKMARFYDAYEAGPYKSERTMRSTMTRDMRKRASEVVTDPAKWNPRKNDLAGFDDGTFSTFTVPKRGVNVAKHAIVAGPLPLRQKVAPPKRDPFALSLTTLPTESMVRIRELEKAGKRYNEHPAVKLYTEDLYSAYQLAVRRNLLPQSPVSLGSDIVPQLQWTSAIPEKDVVSLCTGMNTLVNQTQTTSPVTAYRGTMDVTFTYPAAKARYMSNYLRSQLEVGRSFPMTGFTSTSLSPSYAALIATVGAVERWDKALRVNGAEIRSLGVLMQMEIPEGYPAMYYPHGDEYELILPYQVTYGKFKAKIPYWTLTKKDTIRIRVTRPEFEMAVDLKDAFDREKFDKHVFITIDRVVIRPWERGHVKF